MAEGTENHILSCGVFLPGCLKLEPPDVIFGAHKYLV